MKIKLDSQGVITITPESDLESFALIQFNTKWENESHKGIIIIGQSEGVGDE